jgi:hypothetical protein
VASEDLGESFIAMHDAWRGTSRIGVCMSRMRQLPRLIQIGSLRHEVGHSVLHGSMEYYVFPINEPLMEAAKRIGLSKEYSFNLLYLISIAVKDFEVTRLLSGKGYVDDQVAYSNHVLRTSNEDLNAWQFSRGNAAGMALCLAGRLKDKKSRGNHVSPNERSRQANFKVDTNDEFHRFAESPRDPLF